ncbi:MAG: hypothetical protein LBS88_09565 [Tannerellaceae bacterium]|jgi:hypothetical protein|nr:hypothetical protein [Tannerellaceae bacterium]
MKKHIYIIPMLLAALIVFAGCRKSLKDFTFYYSMESVNNYKLMFSLRSDKTYKIEEHNYFIDNHSDIQAPVIREGTLTDEEYKEAVKYLSACDFFRMNDSYGFDKEVNQDLGDIMYQIAFHTEGKEKYISIRNSDDNRFPSSFIELLRYISHFLKEHPLRQ